MARGVKLVEIADENVGEALGVDGFDITMTTDEATRSGGTGRKQKYAILWQPVGRPRDKMYRPSTINVAAVQKKTALRDEKTGKPLWYAEIPRGGRPESVEPKYKCPACPKRFGAEAVESSNGTIIPGAIQLANHLQRAHDKIVFERWKPLLDKLLATVTVDPTALFADPEDDDVAIVREAQAKPIEPASLEIR